MFILSIGTSLFEVLPLCFRMSHYLKNVRFFHSFVESCIGTICHHKDFTGRVLLWENFISHRNNLIHTQRIFFLARYRSPNGPHLLWMVQPIRSPEILEPPWSVLDTKPHGPKTLDIAPKCAIFIIQGHLVNRYASRRSHALCSRIVFRTVLSLDLSTQTVFLYYMTVNTLRGYFWCFLVSMLRTACYVKQMKSIQFFNPSSVIWCAIWRPKAIFDQNVHIT